LFFFGLFNPRSVRVGDAVATANRYDMSRTNDPFFGGKLDFVPFDGQRLEFTYFDTSGVQTTDSFSFDNTTDEIGGFSSSQLLTYGGKNWVGRYTGNFTEWLTLSAAYGKNKATDSTVASRPDYPTIIDNRSGTPANIGNPTNIQELANDERKFIRGDVDVLVNLFGSHHFRAGYDREKLTSNNTAEYTGNVTYQYYIAGAGDPYAPVGTQYVSARTFINGGIFTSENRAFYLQDNWSLMNNRLQLQLGIRNDRFENRNVEGETFYDSGEQWGPRVGFTFDVLNNNRSKLYGSFGRYFLPIASNTNIRLAGAEFDLTRYNVLNGLNADNTPIIGAPLLFAGADACFDTGILHCENISDGTATPTEATVAKNLKPQSMDEWILGYEHRLPGRMRVGLYGTYRKLNAALEDIAIDAAVLAYCDAEGITDCDETWTGFHQYVLVNPGSDAVVTLSDPINGETSLRTITLSADDLGYPAAKRVYKAITATFNRDFDGKWMAAGSYTYSSLKGNYEGAVKSDNGQDDAGITTDFDQPGLTLGSYGYLPNHRAHTFKAYGAYQLTPWLLLGANVQVTSPRKFGCIGRVPAEFDPFAALYGAAGWFCNVDDQGNIITTGTVPNPAGNAGGGLGPTLTPRGSQFESDWLKEVNLSAAFKLPVDSFGATLRLDVFNILNEQAQLDFEERGTLSNGQPRNTYGLTTAFQRPRFVRLALGVEF
jgi:hypothetical protein